MGRKRQTFSKNFKARVVLEALREEATIQAIAGMEDIFERPNKKSQEVRRQDEKDVEAELPIDKLNMTYKDDAGFAKLCVEFMVKDINYSYIKKETLDILIDFERE